MQTFRSAPVRLLLWTLAVFFLTRHSGYAAAPAKVHLVTLGAVRIDGHDVRSLTLASLADQSRPPTP